MTEEKYRVIPLCHQDMTTIKEFREFLEANRPVLLPAYLRLTLESQFVVAEEYWGGGEVDGLSCMRK